MEDKSRLVCPVFGSGKSRRDSGFLCACFPLVFCSTLLSIWRFLLVYRLFSACLLVSWRLLVYTRHIFCFGCRLFSQLSQSPPVALLVFIVSDTMKAQLKSSRQVCYLVVIASVLAVVDDGVYRKRATRALI